MLNDRNRERCNLPIGGNRSSSQVSPSFLALGPSLQTDPSTPPLILLGERKTSRRTVLCSSLRRKLFSQHRFFFSKIRTWWKSIRLPENGHRSSTAIYRLPAISTDYAPIRVGEMETRGAQWDTQCQLLSQMQDNMELGRKLRIFFTWFWYQDYNKKKKLTVAQVTILAIPATAYVPFRILPHTPNEPNDWWSNFRWIFWYRHEKVFENDTRI